MKSFAIWITVLSVSLLFAFSAFAEDLTEDAGPVKINWTEKELVFTGDGSPNLNAPNAASARIGAERAAYLDALRKALEALKGIKIDATLTVGQKMQSKPAIASKIEGIIRGFKAVGKPRYYSDGGVQIDMKIPIDGVLLSAILGDAVTKQPAKATEKKADAKKVDVKKIIETPTQKPSTDIPTGLVILAKGFKVIPVLAPKIIDQDGKLIYDITMLNKTGLDNGIVRYAKEKELAVKHKKVISNPLVVVALSSPNSVDLVISNDDAKKVRAWANVASFLSDGRVIVVRD